MISTDDITIVNRSASSFFGLLMFVEFVSTERLRCVICGASVSRSEKAVFLFHVLELLVILQQCTCQCNPPVPSTGILGGSLQVQPP